MRETEIGLNHEALQQMRDSLDRAIRQGVARMRAKGASGCRVQLGLDIENRNWSEPDPISGEMRRRSPITFAHECRVSIRFEEREKGGSPERWELMDGQRVCKYDEQLSMLEEDGDVGL
nr:MAG TPA: hypothetical protein [Caudoviricetes sp.]